MTVTVDPHPLLDASFFITELPAPLGQIDAPQLAGHFDGAPPLEDEVKAAIRDLLRHGGFKPSGRSKPASEYLVAAAARGRLGRINAVVDACNAASLRFHIPISVVDLDRVQGDLRVAIAEPGSSYVFNASGQVIDLSGLLCLFDAEGPCANSVKDSQRTKTHDATTRTVSVVWGSSALPERTAELTRWYRALLESIGATTVYLARTTG